MVGSPSPLQLLVRVGEVDDDSLRHHHGQNSYGVVAWVAYSRERLFTSVVPLKDMVRSYAKEKRKSREIVIGISYNSMTVSNT